MVVFQTKTSPNQNRCRLAPLQGLNDIFYIVLTLFYIPILRIKKQKKHVIGEHAWPLFWNGGVEYALENKFKIHMTGSVLTRLCVAFFFFFFFYILFLKLLYHLSSGNKCYLTFWRIYFLWKEKKKREVKGPDWNVLLGLTHDGIIALSTCKNRNGIAAERIDFTDI